MVQPGKALVKLLDLLEENLGLMRGDQAAARAVEQAELQPILHMGQHAADPGLRYGQQFGGAADRLGDHDGTEHLDLAHGKHGRAIAQGMDACICAWSGGGDQPVALLLHHLHQPVGDEADAAQAVVVLVADQPEAAGDAAVGQDALQRRIAVADKAGQHARTRVGGEQAMLGEDAGGAQGWGEGRIEIGQIVEFGRIEQVGDIADELMTGAQVIDAEDRRPGAR
jgi:hypothetical protein